MLIKHKLKAFTIMELLVSMTLTGILVVFAFMGYNQIQKLFVDYTVQSKFISDYNQLQKALFIMADRATHIENSGDKTVLFKTDSSTIALDMKDDKVMLLTFSSHSDTFNLEHKNIHLDYLNISNGMPSALLKTFECEVFFKSQKFRVSFRKEYDAASVLGSTLELLPPDEQP